MSSTKEQAKKEDITFKSIEDVRLTALSSYTSVLSKTIYSFKETESQGIPFYQASSIIFDFVRNYVIYSLPLEILKDTTQNIEQYKHDAYVLTRETIEACNISEREKETLSSILKEPFYNFSAKTYNNLHLVPLIEFVKNALSFDKSEMDSEEVLFFKILCHPFISFFAHEYPLLQSRTRTELEKDIDKFLKVSINAYAQMCIYEKLVATETTSPVEKIIHLLKHTLNILEKTLLKDALDFSVEVLYVRYKTIIQISENKEESKLIQILKVFEKYRRTDFPKEARSTKSKPIKETGENNESTTKGRKRKISTGTAVSRTTPKRTKQRKASKLSDSIQPSNKKKLSIQHS